MFDNTEAACRDIDTDEFQQFFADSRVQKRMAEKYCRKCPTRDECLDWAIVNKQKFGLLGGFTEHERKKLIRRYERELRAQRREAHVA